MVVTDRQAHREGSCRIKDELPFSAMRVYVTQDNVWRIEVRDNGTVRIYEHGGWVKEATSLREAADYLREQGITEEQLQER